MKWQMCSAVTVGDLEPGLSLPSRPQSHYLQNEALTLT